MPIRRASRDLVPCAALPWTPLDMQIRLDKAEVTGSSPVSPTPRIPSNGGVFQQIPLLKNLKRARPGPLWGHITDQTHVRGCVIRPAASYRRREPSRAHQT